MSGEASQWKRDHKDIVAERARWAHLTKKYGVSKEQYEAMFEAQEGCCAICKRKTTQPLSVDHDHRTMKPRALLCVTCNFGIGAFRDDPLLLMEALRYLELHKEQT